LNTSSSAFSTKRKIQTQTFCATRVQLFSSSAQVYFLNTAVSKCFPDFIELFESAKFTYFLTFSKIYPLLHFFSLCLDCATPTPPLVVNSTATTYNSSGHFICENGGVLLNSDGVEETEKQTRCLVTASWSRQDELRCSNGNAIAFQW